VNCAERFYVYGLVAADHSIAPGSLGLGVAGATVELRSYGALSALVSAVGLVKVEQTRRNMVAHTALLERVMAQTTVLPVRFGTIAPGADALKSCIAANEEVFCQAILQIDGRVELGVKATWREGIVFAEILAADVSLVRLRNYLRDRPASETYYERLELGRRIEEQLNDRRSVEAAAIIAELAPFADREAELKTLDDQMVLNRAFLVTRENERHFDKRMQILSDSRQARLMFRYVGPIPPYNFVKLQADWQMGSL